MKNVIHRIRKLSKTGFSCLEMILVVAGIVFILAILVSNTDHISKTEREKEAGDRARLVSSVFTAARAADYEAEGITNVEVAYMSTSNGMTPKTGPFAGRRFIVEDLPDDGPEKARILAHLVWDPKDRTLRYVR